MKLFLGYLIASFFVGLVLWRRPQRQRVWVIAGLIVFVMIGYFFLNQI